MDHDLRLACPDRPGYRRAVKSIRDDRLRATNTFIVTFLPEPMSVP